MHIPPGYRCDGEPCRPLSDRAYSSLKRAGLMSSADEWFRRR
ncbi:hypothetical protein [Methanogenium sp. S4BF]|nr:hypothetical protein [Methanogenium sp. S4BF]